MSKTSSFSNHPRDEDELRLINLPEVRRLTSLSRSSVYQMIDRGEFPSIVKVGRSSRWVAAEVRRWIDTQINNRRPA